VGKHSNERISQQRILKYGTLLSSVAWILKIFVVTALQVFVVDAYHKLTKILMRIPFTALTYETVADRGHYVDEYTVLYEMAINMGRVIMVCIIMLMASLMPLQWTFVFGAIASIFLNLLRARRAPIVRPVVV
jgi:hypothetical protein